MTYTEQRNLENTHEEPISIGSWMLTLLILALPIIGIVMAFVWSFGNTPQKSKKNFSRAILIYWAIAIVISILLSSTLAAMFSTISTYC